MAGGRIHTYIRTHMRAHARTHTHTHAHTVHTLKLCIPTAGVGLPATEPDPTAGSGREAGSRCLFAGGTLMKSLVLIKADEAASSEAPDGESHPGHSRVIFLLIHIGKGLPPPRARARANLSRDPGSV